MLKPVTSLYKLPGNNHPINAGFTLGADEIALVKAWIDEGALNN